MKNLYTAEYQHEGDEMVSEIFRSRNDAIAWLKKEARHCKSKVVWEQEVDADGKPVGQAKQVWPITKGARVSPNKASAPTEGAENMPDKQEEVKKSACGGSGPSPTEADDIAAIKTEYEGLVLGQRKCRDSGIRIGQKLIAIKAVRDTAGHNNWKTWVAETLPFCYTHARRFIRLAQYAARVGGDTLPEGLTESMQAASILRITESPDDAEESVGGAPTNEPRAVPAIASSPTPTQAELEHNDELSPEDKPDDGAVRHVRDLFRPTPEQLANAQRNAASPPKPFALVAGEDDDGISIRIVGTLTTTMLCAVLCDPSYAAELSAKLSGGHVLIAVRSVESLTQEEAV